MGPAFDRPTLREDAHRIRVPDGGRQQLAKTVAALRRPSTYPGGVSRVEAVETHMSWVFLTETHAYKLKKPISTELIDHATVEARHRACVTELNLNRRLARSVYLAVVPVLRGLDGIGLKGNGEVVDWLVEMRRLREDQMLDRCIDEGAVMIEDVDRLGETLTDFFASVERIDLDGTSYRSRIAADIAAKRASLAQPRYELPTAAIDEVYAAQQQWLAEYAELLDGRAAKVVDGHGDLRPEHVCLERPPVVIDCLEFSQQLRSLDPLSELAFLALECRRLGAEWIGDRLLADYRRRSGDHAPTVLVPFYQSHHALIRAAIAVWHLDDDALDHSDRFRKRACSYLRLAKELLVG